MFKRLTIFLVLIFVSGCFEVVSEVEAYSSLDKTAVNKTYAVVPMRAKDANSLEWKHNASKLVLSLQKKGLTVSSDANSADLLVVMGYQINDGESQKFNYSLPRYGVTGYSSASTYGSVYGNSFSSTTTLNPTYGVTGYTQHSGTRVVYTRGLAIDMFDRKTRKKLFEGTAFSIGECSSFAGVAEAMITSIIDDFPSGRVGTFRQTIDTEC